MSPITRVDGVKGQAAPKGKRGDAPIANFAKKGK
jgi:hypothetical protein